MVDSSSEEEDIECCIEDNFEVFYGNCCKE